MNDVIYNMLSVFKQNSNVGTVGARLHFEDGTIQHSGVMVSIDENKNLKLGHLGYGTYYNYTNSIDQVIGNTAALMMIKKTIFIKCKMFNENYLEFFEDVELNLVCRLMGCKNYISGLSVAFHYESISRKTIEGKQSREQKDWSRLTSFINNNYNKIFSNGK